VDDSGFPRTPDRLLLLSGSRAQQSKVVESMTGARGPYNLGGSATGRARRSPHPRGWASGALPRGVERGGTYARRVGRTRNPLGCGRTGHSYARDCFRRAKIDVF
jgi:hypothetical protein